jgi:hypothetical protein
VRGRKKSRSWIVAIAVVCAVVGFCAPGALAKGKKKPKAKASPTPAVTTSPTTAVDTPPTPAASPTETPADGDDGDDSEDAPVSAGPVVTSDDLPTKVTVSVYVLQTGEQADLNVRRKWGPVVGWIGTYSDPKAVGIGRVGGEYDFQYEWLTINPSVQVATNQFIGGQVYAEAGSTFFVIGGYSQTNLKPAFSLSWDPNESAQFGVGAKPDSADRFALFTIADVRLGTGQQDTHLIWKRKFSSTEALTVDFLYKSGHTDAGVYVEGAGLTMYYDRTRWFVRGAYDPYVNFSAETMVRVSGGFRF